MTYPNRNISNKKGAEIALRPFQFCNLCEINFSTCKSEDDFFKRAKIASFFGTLQAGFTDFHYLREVWKKTCEKDALIGIGITGLADDRCNQFDFEKAANLVKQENNRIAFIIGINTAARQNCIKPSGTTSLVLGTSSGIHAWYSEYYLRTMRFNDDEAIITYLKEHNPELLEKDQLQSNTWCLRIPVKAPDTGYKRKDETEVDLLERVKKISQTWIKQGHVSGHNTHNVSATISVKDDKWDIVGKWMWDNKEYYNGLSVLPYDGGTYVQAPFEEITEEEYLKRSSQMKELDFSLIAEEEDNVNLQAEAACAGGACEVI